MTFAKNFEELRLQGESLAAARQLLQVPSDLLKVEVSLRSGTSSSFGDTVHEELNEAAREFKSKVANLAKKVVTKVAKIIPLQQVELDGADTTADDLKKGLKNWPAENTPEADTIRQLACFIATQDCLHWGSDERDQLRPDEAYSDVRAIALGRPPWPAAETSS